MTVRAGPYAMGDNALYRVRDERLEVLAVLSGAGAAADTLEGCATSTPRLGGPRFLRLTLAPDSAWAVWETGGPEACAGVIGSGRPAVRVLGRWPAAIPDSVLWAPASRYVAVWLEHPGQRRSLEVFDAEEGERLEMPWELDCSYAENCDVARAAWLGGTLLNVEIRLGPAELSVPFEVNVKSAMPAGSTEEN